MIEVQTRFIEHGMTAAHARSCGIDVPNDIPEDAIWNELEARHMGERDHDDNPELVIASILHVGEWTWTDPPPKKRFVRKLEFLWILLDLWRRRLARWICEWIERPFWGIVSRWRTRKGMRQVLMGAQRAYFRRPGESDEELRSRILNGT